MPQSDHQLLIESKHYSLAAILAALLCIFSLFSGQLLLTILSGLLCAMLIAGKIKGADTHNLEQSRKVLKWISLGLAAAALIGIYAGVGETKTWLYTVPLLVFFFYDFKPAIIVILILSVITALALNSIGSPFDNIQFTSSYVFYLGISCALVYLRDVRQKQLKPLRRTDNLTQAATREHLDDDLTKEIQRSEREGSELAVMALGIDEDSVRKLSAKQKSAVIIEIGRLLHNSLRVFDSYYLWGEDEFLIVLPHTSSAQANKIANGLRIKVRKEITVKDEKITISIGITGLNVGDDSKALPQKATEALKYSFRKGSNRTQLYREENESSDETRSES
jgi:diguanylate cyclase (GGDEF)-like protein